MAVTTPNRQFIDLDFNLTRNPITGDVSVRKDNRAVTQSIRSLILTRFFERPFQPTVGSRVFDTLFENIDPITESLLEETITEVIENFEPRAELLNVKVEGFPERNEYDIKITFGINNEIDPTTLNITLTKSR